MSGKLTSSGPAVALRGKPPVARWDGVSASLPASVGNLQMCRHWQQRTQDHTYLLDRLVTMAKDCLVDSWGWQVEDVAVQNTWQLEDVACEDMQDQHEMARDWYEEKRDQADWEFQERLLALEEWHIEALEWQAILGARAVEPTKEDCWLLHTTLALVICL
ncbi:hypothetical protein Y1Q_0021416 [Alligator mississippiensis]|uniref:Uncharacterized protein n=1 Tax=Alligator mississippiensis TaxID=8496 RepID=A0A151P9J2_ALLMI|nr:hypothetical protein Y1Q_0021416 [Alligator mississippiensis]